MVRKVSSEEEIGHVGAVKEVTVVDQTLSEVERGEVEIRQDDR